MTQRILIVDADYDSLAALGGALRNRGIEVQLAADGRTALDRAVVNVPDLILFDVAVPLVDARSFVDLIRANPRTADVPIYLMGAVSHKDLTRLPAGSLGAGFFRKPFHVDEVAARLEAALEARARAREKKSARLELRGDLAQVSLPDLLQVFAMNRRNGALELVTPFGNGEVALKDGAVVDAVLGPAAGVKALYRLLGVRSGSFQFVTDRAAAKERINASLDALLVEGMRQLDEIGRLNLPPREAMIESLLPPGVFPAANLDAQGKVVLTLLAQPRTFGDLLDRCRGTDLDAAQTVVNLMAGGVLRVADPGRPRVPIGDADFKLALRARLARTRRTRGGGISRVLVVVPDLESARAIVGALAGIKEFVPHGTLPDGAAPFGDLGTLQVGEGVDLDLYLLPSDERFRPLYGPFTSPAVASLVLRAPASATPDSSEGASRFLREVLAIPTTVAGPDAADKPPDRLQVDWRDSDGVAAALHALLSRFPTGEEN